ncbi:alpha/beta fold hydrolase [Natrinema salifodinae]|uniref:Pimeloyl-ACP methyl ester carboxylesterase n=1 Tax=Natrinema salifodinae TaxID=1202768 RepID=A0A1I0N317_9EURY|nr:alpha/beta fold hydrolase [Natrinema salifodinae]SEV95137.1 Pimeloyl-ACP methyl ester carboxylesterase [Natrinema salifodinae]
MTRLSTSTATVAPTADVGGTGITTIDGCRLAYRRAGTEGSPVVLLHGGGVDDSTLSWRHAIDTLAEDHRVYAPDWPGYGDSEAGPDFEHSIESYVDLLVSFLDDMGLESATLVGISMGGGVALGTALDHADRIDRLALVDSYGLGPRIPAGALWKTMAHVPGANALGWAAVGLSNEMARLSLSRLVADGAALDPEFVEDFRTRAGRRSAGEAFEAFQRNELLASGTVRTDFTDDLGSLSVPTLLVHGADDPLIPAAWSERAAARIPDAELTVLENCGHWTPRERPDAFNEVLTSFCADDAGDIDGDGV